MQNLAVAQKPENVTGHAGFVGRGKRGGGECIFPLAKRDRRSFLCQLRPGASKAFAGCRHNRKKPDPALAWFGSSGTITLFKNDFSNTHHTDDRHVECRRRRVPITLLGKKKEEVMRVTWITSAIAGAAFGFIATLADVGDGTGKAGHVVTYAMLTLFFVSFFVCVIGIIQFRQMWAKRCTSSWISHQIEDGPAFLVPTWGRMAVWFVSAGVGAVLSKAFE